MVGRTVNRDDLSEAVQRVTGLPNLEARALVGQVLEMVAVTLEQGDTVKLSSFGSFVVRQKSERLGRNPRTGQRAPIPARRVVTFKPSPVLKQLMNSPAERVRSVQSREGGSAENPERKPSP
jgi:integration host factor subunit alpha